MATTTDTRELCSALERRLTLLDARVDSAHADSSEKLGPKLKTTIHSLPVELLNLIFELAHTDWLMFALHPEMYSMQPMALRSRSWRGLMKLMYQFPHTPMAVCKLWRDVVTSNPKFWTRAVIFADTKNPLAALGNLRNLLRYSRDLPVVVAVVRKSYNIMYDKEEGMNVSLILEVLLQNLHRFQDMYFHLNQSSSLPSILHFIQRNRPATLSRLALHCDIDDGENLDMCNFNSVPMIKNNRSMLTTLKIDGRNLMSICENPTLWSLVLAHLKCLTLERLQLNEHSERNLSLTSTIEFLSKIPSLEVLTIRDVVFEVSPRVYGVQSPAITVSDLILEDLSDGVVKSIFDHATLNPTYMLMRNVPIDELPQIPQPAYLELSEIGTDQDLEDFLCFWDGEVLAIRSCMGFDDNLLGMFQAEIAPPYHVMLSPSLRELHIQDCPNFSAAALRSMIQIRKEFVERADNKDLDLRYISEIFVCGMGPILNEEDATWFRRNMKTFVWSTIQADGGSCHLDQDSCIPFTV